MVCTAKDISERKQSEEELKKLMLRLKIFNFNLCSRKKWGLSGILPEGVAHENKQSVNRRMNNAQLIKMMAGAGKELKFEEIKDVWTRLKNRLCAAKK